MQHSSYNLVRTVGTAKQVHYKDNDQYLCVRVRVRVCVCVYVCVYVCVCVCVCR